MASASTANGFSPVFHPSGQIRSTAYTIASAYGTAIYKGDPVKLVAGGGIELAAAGDTMIGIFAGVEYKDSDGKPVVANHWTASTTGTEIVAYVWDDPATVFEAELDNGLGATAATSVGATLDHTAGTGSSTTGISGAYLDTDDLTTGGFRIIRKAGVEADVWTDLYIRVQVVINEHSLNYPTASV